MTDPAHAAGTLLQEAFLPFFAEPLPAGLGREIYLTIRRRLQASRYVGYEHTDEVFQQTLCDAFSYLKRHGGKTVRHTRGWLHRISKNATLHYLEARSTVDSPAVSSLDALIEGDAQFTDTSVTSDGMALVRRAIDRLRPRFRQVLVRVLIEGLDDAEIQKRMKIQSNLYFRKLKCEALKALRQEISRLSAN
jgi:DNA-directed RNA polymerase specialized sigma24 family protein